MKQGFIFLLACLLWFTSGYGQNFQAAITNARNSYSSGKLEESHFALMQALQEIDLMIGKEVLKLLPQKMGEQAVATKDDQVTTNTGFIGTTIHRSWGTNRKIDLSIIGNSPLVATINLFLNTPLLGMGSDGNSKLIRVKGYKGQLVKEDASAEGKLNYTVNIPLGNALFTFKVLETTDTEILQLMETIPLEKITVLIQ
jgi:hypothetical protein